MSRFWLGRSGATAIEYALIASVISIAIVAGAMSLGTTLKGFFNSLVGFL